MLINARATLRPNFRSDRLLTVALLLATGLTGCASSDAAIRTAVVRDVPGPPSYLTPVAVADPKEGEYCEAVIERERGGRKLANIKIGRARNDWQAMSVRYKKAATAATRVE